MAGWDPDQFNSDLEAAIATSPSLRLPLINQLRNIAYANPRKQDYVVDRTITVLQTMPQSHRVACLKLIDALLLPPKGEHRKQTLVEGYRQRFFSKFQQGVLKGPFDNCDGEDKMKISEIVQGWVEAQVCSKPFSEQLMADMQVIRRQPLVIPSGDAVEEAYDSLYREGLHATGDALATAYFVATLDNSYPNLSYPGPGPSGPSETTTSTRNLVRTLGPFDEIDMAQFPPQFAHYVRGVYQPRFASCNNWHSGQVAAYPTDGLDTEPADSGAVVAECVSSDDYEHIFTASNPQSDSTVDSPALSYLPQVEESTAYVPVNLESVDVPDQRETTPTPAPERMLVDIECQQPIAPSNIPPLNPTPLPLPGATKEFLLSSLHSLLPMSSNPPVRRVLEGGKEAFLKSTPNPAPQQLDVQQHDNTAKDTVKTSMEGLPTKRKIRSRWDVKDHNALGHGPMVHPSEPDSPNDNSHKADTSEVYPQTSFKSDGRSANVAKADSKSIAKTYPIMDDCRDQISEAEPAHISFPRPKTPELPLAFTTMAPPSSSVADTRPEKRLRVTEPGLPGSPTSNEDKGRTPSKSSHQSISRPQTPEPPLLDTTYRNISRSKTPELPTRPSITHHDGNNNSRSSAQTTTSKSLGSVPRGSIPRPNTPEISSKDQNAAQVPVHPSIITKNMDHHTMVDTTQPIPSNRSGAVSTSLTNDQVKDSNNSEDPPQIQHTPHSTSPHALTPSPSQAALSIKTTHNPTLHSKLPSRLQADTSNSSSTPTYGLVSPATTPNPSSTTQRYPLYDPSLPTYSIKVLSRTIQVSSLRNGTKTTDIHSLFSKYGQVVNFSLSSRTTTHMDASVQFATRASAVAAKNDAPNIRIHDVPIKVTWTYSFGPNAIFDYECGYMILETKNLKFHETKLLEESAIGGFRNSKIRVKMIVEEPGPKVAASNEGAVSSSPTVTYREQQQQLYRYDDDYYQYYYYYYYHYYQQQQQQQQ